jgi:hypothetical protein
MQLLCTPIPIGLGSIVTQLRKFIGATDLNGISKEISSQFENFANLGNTCSAKRVFVTSQTFNGYLKWYPGADAVCQTAANDADLGGTWRAWLSGNGGDRDAAKTRFTHSNIPYRRIDNKLVANDWSDLTDGIISNPINVDEYGNAITDQSFNSTKVWTNTAINGSAISSIREGNCDNFNTTDLTGWNGIFGDINSQSSTWTKGADKIFYSDSLSKNVNMPETTDCERGLRLYCFEQ